ncbi:antibiotic biosynthesis monooxygenase [Flavobacteriaceae bacterium R38]|nr:antibiotic biosynthesis monooxygenase [Flavobacteriaceae bacterium R38]
MKTKPYYAVIFTTTRTEGDHGYEEMAQRMDELAKKQPGYIGVESARSELGITVSYWENLEAISKWKENSEHTLAREMGREKWYSWYKLRVCLVEREYEFTK